MANSSSSAKSGLDRCYSCVFCRGPKSVFIRRIFPSTRNCNAPASDKGSGAERAGLRTGDVMIALGKTPLRDAYDLENRPGSLGSVTLRSLPLCVKESQ
jgi:hypothetical protein